MILEVSGECDVSVTSVGTSDESDVIVSDGVIKSFVDAIEVAYVLLTYKKCVLEYYMNATIRMEGLKQSPSISPETCNGKIAPLSNVEFINSPCDNAKGLSTKKID